MRILSFNTLKFINCASGYFDGFFFSLNSTTTDWFHSVYSIETLSIIFFFSSYFFYTLLNWMSINRIVVYFYFHSFFYLFFFLPTNSFVTCQQSLNPEWTPDLISLPYCFCSFIIFIFPAAKWHPWWWYISATVTRCCW